MVPLRAHTKTCCRRQRCVLGCRVQYCWHTYGSGITLTSTTINSRHKVIVGATSKLHQCICVYPPVRRYSRTRWKYNKWNSRLLVLAILHLADTLSITLAYYWIRINTVAIVAVSSAVFATVAVWLVNGQVVAYRLVLEFSALNTGPTSKTLFRSPEIAICLYSCGDCARHACCRRYNNNTRNTLHGCYCLQKNINILHVLLMRCKCCQMFIHEIKYGGILIV